MSPVRDGILLTGATGFLGGYLLRELLDRTQAQVFCLARPSEKETAEARLMDNLVFLFGKDGVAAWPRERITVLEGDLGSELLGLPASAYRDISESVGAIFNAAAMLWHFGRKELFEQVNVQGVKRLLDLARSGRPKALNHISTLAVSGRRVDNPGNLFRETDFHETMECPNAYVQTKYEAEKVFRPAIAAGENVRIFRPGFVMGDSQSGRFKKEITLDAQYLHLRGHILMKVAPPLYADDYMDVTPVDYAAAAIAHIALAQDTADHVYHVCNPRPILKAETWEIIRAYGYQARVIPAEAYMECILSQEESDEFLQGLQHVLIYLGDYEKSPAVFDCVNTLRALEGTDIRCPMADRPLLHRYLDYCVDIGFLPKPDRVDIRE
ncbi:MAG: thioester reductase domain-containing protein [Desulfocurvibacter africanus]